jgi:hypothetical protein
MNGGMSEVLRSARGSAWGRALRRAGALALPALLLVGLLPAAARAQGPSADDKVFVRLYYSEWMTGRLENTPADPAGRFAGNDTVTMNPKAALEVIFLRRIGLSYSRQKLLRDFVDPAGTVAGCGGVSCRVSETGVQQSLDLTLYGRRVEHDQFNLFAGGGAGYLDYGYRANGVQQTSGDLYKSIPLARYFFGLEYTFERIGFRIEVSHTEADKTLGGVLTRVRANYRYLTLVIPLN